jgi:GT2 family glycosyltransferase
LAKRSNKYIHTENNIESYIKKTCVVTVTYADRYKLLVQMLECIISLGVQHVIIVDNGSHLDSAGKLDTFAAKHPESASVCRLEQNIGSAGGYNVGLKKAIETDAEYIWLLDDDNLPSIDTLQILFKAYDNKIESYEKNALAVLAFRKDHQVDIAIGVSFRWAYPRPGSFWGFHILDLPFKIWRRTSWGRPKVPSEGILGIFSIPWAPYSGFLFHRDVISRIGLPDERFVLYGDDNEYTSRLTRSGGKIFLVTQACMKDMDVSWNIKDQYKNSFKGWLLGGQDFRAYYTARNHTYLDRILWGYNSYWLRVNMGVYLFGLLIYAVLLNKMDRFTMIYQAVRDALNNKLGFSCEHKLR